MCYTTNKDVCVSFGSFLCHSDCVQVRISTDLFSSTAYGVNGYRSDCRYSAFTDIITINHDTKRAAWFTRNNGVATTPFIATASTGYLWYTNLGLFRFFTGFGVAVSSQYQLLVCDSGGYYSGFFMSGMGQIFQSIFRINIVLYLRIMQHLSHLLVFNAFLVASSILIWPQALMYDCCKK